MAVVIRYFSTTGAGAADGTTWADRAALFSAGNWSTVITGFAFNGSDSMEARIGPGTYTCSQSLASGLFANPPTAANPLLLHGCDSSGNLLTPPDPNWVSCMPAWDASGLGVIATTTNIATLNLANLGVRLLKFTASGRNGTVAALNNASNVADWIVIENSTSNSSAGGATVVRISNSVLSCTGSSYAYVVQSEGTAPPVNCRVSGVAGSSGNRYGFNLVQASSAIHGCTAYGVGGAGMILSSASAGASLMASECTVANVGGVGILLPSTASQTALSLIERCCITGCGSYGIDAQSAARAVIAHNRLRDNTSGNTNGFGNYPTDWNNYTTDSDDATEYVDASSTFDFRIKSGAAIHGGGYGAGDQVSSAGGIKHHHGMTGGLSA